MKRILPLLLLIASPAWGAIAYVSASHKICLQTTASVGVSCSLLASTTSGNTVVAFLSWKTTTRQINYVSSSTTGAMFWPASRNNCNGSGTCSAIAVCQNCAAITTVTPNFSGTTIYTIAVEEYSGVSSIGGYIETTGTSTNPHVAYTLDDANDWLVCSESNLANAGIPTANQGNLRDANRTGTTSSFNSGAAIDNTAASGSVTCGDTITSGAWAIEAVELRTAGPSNSNQAPNCDGVHPCLIYDYTSVTGAQDTASAGLNALKIGVDATPTNSALVLTLKLDDATSGTPNTVSSITDSGSNTWGAAVATADETTEHYMLAKYVVCGAASISSLTVNLTNNMTSAMTLQITLKAYSRIASTSCTDGSSAGVDKINNSSTAILIQPGSFTTTANGDMIDTDAQQSHQTFNESIMPPYRPDTADSFIMTNTTERIVEMHQLQTTAGAANPGFWEADTSTGNERNWSVISVALKPDSTKGSEPTGMKIVRVLHYNCSNSGGTNFCLSQFPSTGNLLLFTTPNQPPTFATSNLGDQRSNTYNLVTRPNSADPQMDYTCNSTTSLQHTISWQTATTTFYTLYDVTGARIGGGSTGCFDTSNERNGGQCSQDEDIPLASCGTSNFPGAADITPTTSNGLIFVLLSMGEGAPTAIFNVSGAVMDSMTGTNMTDGDGYSTGDGTGHYYNPSTSTVNFKWHIINHFTAPVGGSSWNSISAAFMSPAGVSRHRALVIQSQ